MPKDPVFTAAQQEQKGMEEFSHPLNPDKSRMRGLSLSEAAGLKRVGVHVAVLPPGRESFVYHAHAVNEEWLYALSGRGRMEIDGRMHELGPGDFVGFTAPSAPHQLFNPYDEELRYLTGGERQPVEVAAFPRLGMTMVFAGKEANIFPTASGRPFPVFVGEEPEDGEPPASK